MTNIIIISILVVGATEIVRVDGECQTNGGPIESCCCLGYKNTHFNAKSSGVYTIGNFGGVKCSTTKVYCDTTSGGGRWIVIQRRKDARVDFNRDWVDYEDGFGSLTGDFWFGLRGMHTLTANGQWELRIDYTLTNGTKGYLWYSNFKVGPTTEQYPLNISGFSGFTSDPFYINDKNHNWSLNRMKFTTRDRKNDNWIVNLNCAIHHNGVAAGGWWYNACSGINLNHPYNNKRTLHLNGHHHALPFVEMKIKPKNCFM